MPEVGGAEEPLDLGDGFDAPPRGAGDASGFVDPYEEPVIITVTEADVRAVFDLLGSTANLAAPADLPDMWLFTEQELRLLVPAMTSIANRHQWLARLIAGSDYLRAGAGFALYLNRNVSDLRALRAEGDPHADLDAEAPRPGPVDAPPADSSALRPDGQPWGTGIPAEEAAGLGAFQG